MKMKKTYAAALAAALVLTAGFSARAATVDQSGNITVSDEYAFAGANCQIKCNALL